ncbi:MAG: hypothetical protein PHT13_07485, partial [Methanosarcina sp.]|nr:hypothetical protein [Methanosarcina sp.]
MSTYQRKCRIGIFGTKDDQENLDKIIKSIDLGGNVDILRFTKTADFGIDEAHTHKTCVYALSTCNIAIFFINRRYGGKFQPDVCWEISSENDWCFEISVTHAEYRTAKELCIPTIVFIDYNTYKEYGYNIRERHFRVVSQNGENKESIKKNMDYIEKHWEKSNHVQDPKLFFFINEITTGMKKDTGMNKKELYQNWKGEKYVYDDLDDEKGEEELKQKIINAIKGLTPIFLRQLSEKQASKLQEELRVGPQISYKFMDGRGLLVEREFKDDSGKVVKQDQIYEEKKVLIIGSGSDGKTFTMVDLFSKHVSKCIDNNSLENNRDIPLFISLKNKIATLDNVLDVDSLVWDEM